MEEKKVIQTRKISVLFLVFCMLVTLISCGNQNTESNNNNSSISEKTEIAGIIFKNQLFTYDGTEHYLEITGSLPYGVEVEYENNGQVNAGEYTVVAKFKDTTGNYIVPNEMQAMMIITKCPITGISFEGKTITYDGNKHFINITGTLPDGVFVEYTNNGQVNVGEYKVTATFVDETGNYIVPNSMKATLIITKEGGNSSSGNDNNPENTDEMKTKWEENELLEMLPYPTFGKCSTIDTSMQDVQVGNIKSTVGVTFSNCSKSDFDNYYSILETYGFSGNKTSTGGVSSATLTKGNYVISLGFYGSTFSMTIQVK